MTKEEAIDLLAIQISKVRVGNSVYMNGSHHPTPVELYAAAEFIKHLIHAGWNPPTGDSE